MHLLKYSQTGVGPILWQTRECLTEQPDKTLSTSQVLESGNYHPKTEERSVSQDRVAYTGSYCSVKTSKVGVEWPTGFLEAKF